MSKTCTWKDCDKLAVHVWKSRVGDVWAWLCDFHHKQLDNAIAFGDARKILSCYVKAQGGAQAAAKRMVNNG